MTIHEIQKKIAAALNGVEALVQGGCVTTAFYNHPYGNRRRCRGSTASARPQRWNSAGR